MKLLMLALMLCISMFGAQVNRNLIAFYDSSKQDNERLNPIHETLEVILNYYGYIVDYADIQNPPQNLSKYYGAIFWFADNIAKDPVQKIKYIASLKNDGLKILWFGSIPLNDGGKNLNIEINNILEKEFDFKIGDVWSGDAADIKISSDILTLNFEKRFGFIDSGLFLELKPTKSVDTLINAQLVSDNIQSPAVFKTNWGVYGQDDKLVFRDASDPNNQIKRWIVNPFEFVKNILPTNFPVPDVTTINGKRVAYIHLDGDGALSKSEVIKGANCAEVYYQKIAKVYPFKTGVSFIVSELSGKNGAQIVPIAKNIYALDYIEAASHTYSHPLNWKTGLMAYGNDNAPKAMHGNISAHSAGKVDDKLEIKDSVTFINSLLPKGKTSNSLYWSGDCLPTKKDLDYAKENNILAFNGGDSFFDSTKPSYAYLYPLTRYVDGTRQIYSTGSNEYIYTNLWSENFWAFARVVETFKRTGAPVRIMPINLYYHFYSLEKMASYKALDSVYRYLNSIKNDTIFIYPTDYMKSVNAFFETQVFVENKKFTVTNCANLNTLRMSGNVKLKDTKGVSGVTYDAKQNVTYIAINSDTVSFEVISD